MGIIRLMNRIRFFWSVAVAFAMALSAAAVTLESLLGEMTDLDRATYHPGEVRVRQWSSHDRASVRPGADGWFANADRDNFLRAETNAAGRVEDVLADAEGPGAIVRFWMTQSFADPDGGVLRIYLDGSGTPVVEGPARRLIGGGGLAPSPMSFEVSRACNLYLPIPYLRRCKVTIERKDMKGPFYYNLETRRYPSGTPVETFSSAALERAKPAVAAACEALGRGLPLVKGAKRVSRADVTLAPGEELVLSLTGPAAVRRLAREETIK